MLGTAPLTDGGQALLLQDPCRGGITHGWGGWIWSAHSCHGSLYLCGGGAGAAAGGPWGVPRRWAGGGRPRGVHGPLLAALEAPRCLLVPRSRLLSSQTPLASMGTPGAPGSHLRRKKEAGTGRTRDLPRPDCVPPSAHSQGEGCAQAHCASPIHTPDWTRGHPSPLGAPISTSDCMRDPPNLLGVPHHHPRLDKGLSLPYPLHPLCVPISTPGWTGDPVFTGRPLHQDPAKMMDPPPNPFSVPITTPDWTSAPHQHPG